MLRVRVTGRRPFLRFVIKEPPAEPAFYQRGDEERGQELTSCGQKETS